MNIKRVDIVNIFYSVFHYLPSYHYAGFTLNINPPPSIPTSKCCRCCQRTSQCHSGHCDINHAQITIAEYRIVLSSPNAIIQCFAHTNHALEYGLKYTLYSFSWHRAHLLIFFAAANAVWESLTRSNVYFLTLIKFKSYSMHRCFADCSYKFKFIVNVHGADSSLQWR